MPARVLAATLALTLIAAMALGPTASFADEGRAEIEFFEKRIRPVLVQHCYECHSAAADEPKGGLRLDSRPAVRAGGASGPAVVLGRPGESVLIAALRHESLAMPPETKLPEAVIADFTRWIEAGAADPRDEPPDPRAAAARAWEEQVALRQQWWSLQPVAAVPVPEPREAGWPAQPVDRFILSRLESEGLRPAPRADRPVLIRRLSYVLTGLPPAPEDVRAFQEDTSPDAWERLVDRLLASPHFGERWARHWMDVVRYTDTYGYEWDIPAEGSWRYRDYLVRAFNDDVPFDQLVREQIAGDLLAAPRIDPVERVNASLAGLMFFQMGEKRHGDSAEFDGIHQEMLDNKIDAFSKAFLASTVACARCHDHKLDAIGQDEYYALAGVFMSSRWVTNTLDLPDRHADAARELNGIKKRLRGALARQWLGELETVPDDLRAATDRETPGGDAAENAAGASVAAVSEGDTSAGEERPSAWRKLLSQRSEGERPLEDPLTPWIELARAVRQGTDPAERWRTLAAQYEEQREVRTAQNARDFEVVADFRHGVPEGWSVDGAGLAEPVACGDFTVALEGPAAVGRLLPGGLFTHALSPRLNGAIRTPWLDHRFDKSHLSFEYVGGDFSAHRTVVDNAFLTERQGYLNQPDLGWLRLPTRPGASDQSTMEGRRVFIELATKTSNPNFPPRVGLGGACSEEQARDPRSWFGVRRVLQHDQPGSPADELSRFAGLFDGPPPADLEEAAERYAGWFRSAVSAWAEDRATEDDVRLINWLLDQELLSNRIQDTACPDVARFVEEYRERERQLPLPQTVNGMADVDPGFDYPLHIRGEYDKLGDPVPRGGPLGLSGPGTSLGARANGSPQGGPSAVVAGSGRRELAEWVASSDNPLTARVFVNRVWHWLFGTGLVATTDDFGHLGATPSHPELLDFLAGRFMAEGWSLKKLVRMLVLTETWRQSNEASERAVIVDPDNRLLHHFPLRRLEAEAIRDSILAVSGRLDPRLFGPAINPPRQNEDPQKRLFSGPVDGEGRRSLYTKITIMEPPRFLATFNQPEPKIPTGRRDVTNTPAQSLALLNDPFVSGQAEHWARRLTESGHAGVEDRIEEMFLAALGRGPTADETALWSAAVADFASLRGVSPDQVLDNRLVWTDVAHALFNTKEFVSLR